MEEDIVYLEEVIDFAILPNTTFFIQEKEIKAIRNILKEYKKKDMIIEAMAEHIFLMNDNGGLTNKEKIEYFKNKVEREVEQ